MCYSVCLVPSAHIFFFAHLKHASNPAPSCAFFPITFHGHLLMINIQAVEFNCHSVLALVALQSLLQAKVLET